MFSFWNINEQEKIVIYHKWLNCNIGHVRKPYLLPSTNQFCFRKCVYFLLLVPRISMKQTPYLASEKVCDSGTVSHALTVMIILRMGTWPVRGNETEFMNNCWSCGEQVFSFVYLNVEHSHFIIISG